MAKPDRLLEAFIDLRDRIVNVVLRISAAAGRRGHRAGDLRDGETTV